MRETMIGVTWTDCGLDRPVNVLARRDLTVLSVINSELNMNKHADNALEVLRSR